MNLPGWLQLALFIGLLFAVTKPLGLYLARVLEPEGKTWLDRPVKPVERLIYRILGIDPKTEQDWRHYARSLIVFSLAGRPLSAVFDRPRNSRCAGRIISPGSAKSTRFIMTKSKGSSPDVDFKEARRSRE